MDLNYLSEWLRTTVVGIIILGAAGSVLAYYFLKLIGKIFGKWIPDWLKIYQNQEVRRGYRLGFVTGAIVASKDSIKMEIYLNYRFNRLVFYLSFFIVFNLFFVYTLSQVQTSNLLTVGTFFSIVAALLCLRFAFNELKASQFLYQAALKEELGGAETIGPGGF